MKRFVFVRCAIVMLLLCVTLSSGLERKNRVRDTRIQDDVDIDDVIQTTNVGQHLENSVKKVQRNMTSNALKVICQLLPCSDWSAWTACGSLVGRYGTRNRTRHCGYNVSKLCTENMSGFDIEVGECMIYIPWCPLDYVYTRNGFCVKLYNGVYKSWYDAEIHCESDGGHLVNIDTKQLSEDINESFDDTEILSVYAWVDGIRRFAGNEWEYKSGLKKPKFTNWYRDHPGEDSFPNCKCIIRSGDEGNFEWRSSYVCGNRENFICQIKKG